MVDEVACAKAILGGNLVVKLRGSLIEVLYVPLAVKNQTGTRGGQQEFGHIQRHRVEPANGNLVARERAAQGIRDRLGASRSAGRKVARQLVSGGYKRIG